MPSPERFSIADELQFESPPPYDVLQRRLNELESEREDFISEGVFDLVNSLPLGGRLDTIRKGIRAATTRLTRARPWIKPY